MSHTRVALSLVAAAALCGSAAVMQAQAPAAAPAPAQTVAPTNDLPNPFETITNYFKLPEGRTWGSTSAVDIDKDGKTIWVAERCGGNSCWDTAKGAMNPADTILHFDASGKLIKSFGGGSMIFPHGIHVDRDGNVWVTDGQDNYPRRARGAAADAPLPAPPAKIIGHQVFKYSPDGKLLMTLGKAGGNQPGQPADPASFYQPNDVIVMPNGEILVAEGHSSAANAGARIARFSKDGKYVGDIGKRGTGPGEFDQPHALAYDSQGRLFVGDRGNNRTQIFDKDYKFVADWPQFSRPSGIFIDKNDMLYVADSESGSVSPPHKAWLRGIRFGSAKDGKVIGFIPDPDVNATNTSAAEGVTADSAGNIYGAEVGPRQVKKYVRKK